MGKIPDLSAIRDWCKSIFQPIGNYAASSDIPTQTSQLMNDSGYITNETDNLANYYKKSETYTKDEVDAKAFPGGDIPTKTSDLTNDSGFITKSVNDLENYYKKTETYNQSEADEKFAEKAEIPTNTSDLNNDSGYITEIPVATVESAGKVKPDGTTITIDADGTIHAVSSQELAENILGGES